MRRLLLTPIVLSAACSAQPTAAPAPTPSPGPVARSAPRPAATPVAVVPKPGELKTFGDWTVGCDNVAICTLASLGPEMGDFPLVTLNATRQPGPGGGWALAFSTRGDQPPIAVASVAVDGDTPIALPQLDGAPAAAVVAAMANGQGLAVRDAGGRVRQRISLKGASAALRWIDAAQARAGTVTAVVARGPVPAATVPPRRALPVIIALRPSGKPETPTAAQVTAMLRQGNCDSRSPGGTDLGDPEAHALGGGTTLVLLPCSTGAYNLSQALFVLKGGTLAPARVDAPVGFDATPAAGTDRLSSIVNGTWKEGELTGYAKGRGLGDCGVSQTLVWDGTRLRLSEQAMMGECRGNSDYIVTWRTRVERR